MPGALGCGAPAYSVIALLTARGDHRRHCQLLERAAGHSSQRCPDL